MRVFKQKFTTKKKLPPGAGLGQWHAPTTRTGVKIGYKSKNVGRLTESVNSKMADFYGTKSKTIRIKKTVNKQISEFIQGSCQSYQPTNSQQAKLSNEQE